MLKQELTKRRLSDTSIYAAQPFIQNGSDRFIHNKTERNTETLDGQGDGGVCQGASADDIRALQDCYGDRLSGDTARAANNPHRRKQVEKLAIKRRSVIWHG